ncbi:MAG: NAD-dependent epimerase/dehydratase family protein [Bacteroidia bacterium]
MENKQKIVITGAAGFLGGRVAKYMASHYSNYQIVATSRRSSRAAELENTGCSFLAGDLTNPHFCEQLTQNAEIVVHCAALSAPYGDYETFYQSNYVATESLLSACLKNGVKKFIFISTPSIYMNFSSRLKVKESDPLPSTFVNHYASTKLMAEKYVLNANGKGIQTIALRPRAIIGAEDVVIFPRVLAAYHEGKLKIIGKGDNYCDFTCARNVIEAIICSINAQPQAYGEAYNITDGQSLLFWEALKYALTSLNLSPPTKKIPKAVAMFAANLAELSAKIFKHKKEPTLTRYGICILSDSMTLDISKAKKNLGYQPVMNTFDGINEYIQWYKTNK